MPKYIELSPMEVKLGFVASCVEFAAHAMGLPYDVVYQRMKKVGLIEKYIFPYYDVLHTYSREHVTDDVVGCLTEWEGRA